MIVIHCTEPLLGVLLDNVNKTKALSLCLSQFVALVAGIKHLEEKPVLYRF